MEIVVVIITCLVTAIYITSVIFLINRRKKSGTIYIVKDGDGEKPYLFLELSEDIQELRSGQEVVFKVKSSLK